MVQFDWWFCLKVQARTAGRSKKHGAVYVRPPPPRAQWLARSTKKRRCITASVQLRKGLVFYLKKICNVFRKTFYVNIFGIYYICRAINVHFQRRRKNIQNIIIYVIYQNNKKLSRLRGSVV